VLDRAAATAFLGPEGGKILVHHATPFTRSI
jgi:hypothetical protein